jgi:adenylosuccinate synthase
VTATEQHATILVDLAFGDCGKGTIVDFLIREALERNGEPPLVVRFNGGPQAGHNVVTPASDGGRHHTFAQFGSGTLADPRVCTLLSRFMLIEPYAMINEARHLESIGVRDALGRLLVHEDCLVITPAHQAANRLRELARGAHAHGTCGMGVGEAVGDSIAQPELALRARELRDGPAAARKLRETWETKRTELADAIERLRDQPRAMQAVETLLDPGWIDVAIDNYAWLGERVLVVNDPWARRAIREGTCIFEGAQGVLLDENFGFHPHTTWSTTTTANALALLDEAGFAGRRERLGVLRTYFTRHGAGPLVTEDQSLRGRLFEPHNHAIGWQGEFRVGAFDAVAARYALKATGGVDGIAMTHLDRLHYLPPRFCDAYELDGKVLRDLQPSNVTRSRPMYTPTDEDRFTPDIEQALGVRVTLASYGPTWLEKSRMNAS